ncbi:MAG: hypothetical protein RL088_1109 [Verrucomicrobiota bacterium]|jgi:hypothetical protein
MNPRLLVKLRFLLLAASPCFADSTAEHFESRIRPVLHDRCSECHGAEKQKGGLRLDSRESMLAGGDTGPAISPGKPADSLLLKAIRHEDKDLAMPPAKSGKPLTAAVIADFEKWIADGAVWPGAKGVPAKRDVFDIAERKQRLPWLWQTPQRQSVPEAPGNTEVDRFISAGLLAKGLAPAPPADDLTWLRRVYFAITGLPPGRDEMHAFLADATQGRRERVVDSLLASPHFGERWARHWMDVVRYAESRGHEEDYIIANAWQYRDYLIRAFNSDLPYNRFVEEHIAGDIIPPRSDSVGANESVLATGWAFLGEEVHTPVDILQDECERVDNKVDVLSKAFLGLTVACARCHDHKFDAISQRDYYALTGFVLGSPYRQVRFATMQPHADVARRLATLRAEHAPRIIKAMESAPRGSATTTAAALMAARRVLFGESPAAVSAATGIKESSLSLWLAELKAAVASQENPLHTVTMLAHEPEALNPERFPSLLAKRLSAHPPAPERAQIIADYTAPDRTPWKTDGPSFGIGPVPAGQLVFDTPGSKIPRITAYGAAVRDPFWNRLSLSPGTEMDSGILAAAARSGRTLLTPKFTLRSGLVHFLLRGKASVYAGVDSHIMVVGGLHERLLANFDTGGKLQWVTQNLGAYAGHRAHLEIAPRGDSPLEVLMVVESGNPQKWMPAPTWRPKQPTGSLQALAEAFANDVASATVETAPALVNWVARNPALFESDSGGLLGSTVALNEAQEALSKTVHWNSPTAVSWADGTGVDASILIRGKPGRPGAIAPRGLPEALGFPRIATTETSGRAELASQLSDPANPLVARVMVNRIWHHLFGRGIVPTPDNFGYLGERPSHPELLDHLAWLFVHEDGWSVKSMIRRIVLTDAFARSSRAAESPALERDPSNLLLHRYPVRRLEAEAIRDALLTVSGRLDRKQQGPPVPVHLTEFIIGRGRPGTSGPLDGAGRRSIYTSVRRNFLPTMLLAFDMPTPFSTVGRRNTTNVPAQSLVFMNDPFVREQAALLSARMQRECPSASPESRIGWLFETTFCRPAQPAEVSASHASLEELKLLHTNESTVWAEFCHALLSANDFIYLR